MSIFWSKRQKRQQKVDSLVPLIETIIEGRTNALAIPARKIAKILHEQYGIKVHEAYVNEALEVMGYEKIEGSRMRVKEK